MDAMDNGSAFGSVNIVVWQLTRQFGTLDGAVISGAAQHLVGDRIVERFADRQNMVNFYKVVWGEQLAHRYGASCIEIEEALF